MESGDQVLGHFSCTNSGQLQPLLLESSPLFIAVVNDDVEAVRSAIEAPGAVSRLHLVLHWSSDVEEGACEAKRSRTLVKSRTLLHVACLCGSQKVSRLLLDAGANPQQMSPDGLTARQFAQQATANSAQASIISMLQVAENRDVSGPVSVSAGGEANPIAQSADVPSISLSLTSQGTDTLRSSSAHFSDGDPTTVPAYGLVDAQLAHLMQSQGDVDIDNPFHPGEGQSFSTSDMAQSEFSTDEWRMFGFKVTRCNKRFAHDWRTCPFAHPTENARRRDPREFRYCAIACPDYKQGFCIRGDACPYAHGVFECWLHPSRYRTQLCKDGANCHRPICFFAHSLPELRTPTHTWTPGPEDLANSRSSSGNLSSPATQGGATPGPVGTGHHGKHGGGGAGMGRPSPLRDASASAATSPARAAGAGAGAGAPPVVGFTAPRMSNAFARRHGLNPKDNAMLNLQKIALQAQALQQGSGVLGMEGGPPVMVAPGGGYMPMGHPPGGHMAGAHMGMSGGGYMPGGGGVDGGRGMGTVMAVAVGAGQKPAYHNQPQPMPPMAAMHPAYASPYLHSAPQGGMQGGMQGGTDPTTLAALNNHLAALSLQQQQPQAGFGGGPGGHGHMGGAMMMAHYGGGYGHQHSLMADAGGNR